MAHPEAELVLTGGRIFRGLGLPDCEALAVADGRVVATGDAQAVARHLGPSTEVHDLGGRFACPGLIDAHLHLLPLGLTLGEVDARPPAIGSVAALVEAIRARAATLPAGRWIVARGYDDHRLAERRHPTLSDLDRAAPDNPVYLARSCGHVTIGNSAAFALAGIDAGTVPPQGGRIELLDGRPTGKLEEGARNLLRAVLPPSSDGDLVEAIERAGGLCLSHGITSVMDAAVGARAGWREVEAYRTARAAGRLPLRVHLALVGGRGGIMERAMEEGLRTGDGDGHLTVGPAKLFADGSAGARTAALSGGYEGEPANRGMLYLSDARMRELVGCYHEAGFQVATHAVGDLAIEQVLDAYEAALGGRGAAARRHRIEHATFATPGQAARMARLGVTPVAQPVFLVDYGAMYLSNVGAERAAAAFPLRSWRAAGLRPPASTDCPVSRLAPLVNYAAMLARDVGHAGSETLSGEEALDSYTACGAAALGEEHRLGRLVPGLQADIAVFSGDLLAAGPGGLAEITCAASYVSGRLAYGSAAYTGSAIRQRR